MTSIAALTGKNNYFEDFKVGELIEHARGKTVTEMDNVLLTHLVMNTAQGHFNEDRMRQTEFGQRIVFGGVTASITLGLTTQDIGENALAELALDQVRFPAPVFHGDTLYAFSEILRTEDSDRPDAGVVTVKHWGVNQRDEVVFEGTRRVLVKRRGAGRAT